MMSRVLDDVDYINFACINIDSSYVLLCFRWLTDALSSSLSALLSIAPVFFCRCPSCTTRRNSHHKQSQPPCTWILRDHLGFNCSFSELILQTHHPIATDFIGNLYVLSLSNMSMLLISFTYLALCMKGLNLKNYR